MCPKVSIIAIDVPHELAHSLDDFGMEAAPKTGRKADCIHFEHFEFTVDFRGQDWEHGDILEEIVSIFYKKSAHFKCASYIIVTY